MLEVHIQLNLLSIIRCHDRNESYTSSSGRMYPCDNIPLFYYHICQPGAERPTFLHDFKNTIDATNCCIPSKPQILKSSKRSVGIYRFSSTFNTIIYHKLTTLRRFSHWIERQKKKPKTKCPELENEISQTHRYSEFCWSENFALPQTMKHKNIIYCLVECARNPWEFSAIRRFAGVCFGPKCSWNKSEIKKIQVQIHKPYNLSSFIVRCVLRRKPCSRR